jgi:hypothetical protein
MASSIGSSEFQSLVRLHFGFLSDEYGYAIMDRSDWSCNFHGSNTKISLLVEHASFLSVDIEPIGEQAKWLLRQNIIPESISVVVVSMCLDPNLRYRVARLHGKAPYQDIPVEMQNRSRLLKKYCRKMLAGDFSEWKVVMHCASERAYEFLSL